MVVRGELDKFSVFNACNQKEKFLDFLYEHQSVPEQRVLRRYWWGETKSATLGSICAKLIPPDRLLSPILWSPSCRAFAGASGPDMGFSRFPVSAAPDLTEGPAKIRRRACFWTARFARVI